MQRKALMGMAAVAGIALLLYIRRKGASDDAASASGVLTSNAALINAAMGNVWGGSAGAAAPVPAPEKVSDTRASSPAPAPAAQNASQQMAWFGVSNERGEPVPDTAKYHYMAAGHSAPVTDAAKIAELDGVRAFVNGRDVNDADVLRDIVGAAQGQGMSYWQTMNTLGLAYNQTPDDIARHMSERGVGAW